MAIRLFGQYLALIKKMGYLLRMSYKAKLYYKLASRIGRRHGH